MTPELADKIMTRIIARVEADGGVLHKSSGIEEIIGACAVAEAEGEIVDVISYDEQKGQWVHRDGKPLDMGDDRAPVEVRWFSAPPEWGATIENLGDHEVRVGDTIVLPGRIVTIES